MMIAVGVVADEVQHPFYQRFAVGRSDIRCDDALRYQPQELLDEGVLFHHAPHRWRIAPVPGRCGLLRGRCGKDDFASGKQYGPHACEELTLPFRREIVY